MTASAGTSLPMPDDLGTGINPVGMIKPAIKLTLQNIAQFTVTVIRRKLYLAKLKTFDELHDYHVSNCVTHQHRYDTAALGPGHKFFSGEDHEVPIFTVQRVGNSFEGH